ncbi:MAG: nucleotidyltransferase family protein [Candidatus Obscuribacterales bacterium]|nr:nucleotidyltransferase family protein [Candidatus Obscuribacterales bacterium]
MSEPVSVAIVILAAGSSSRMGRPKQNLVFRGKTLLQTTIDAACGAVGMIAKAGISASVLVVLGANEEAVRANNDFGNCDAIVNTRWAEGMSSSICCALSHLANSSRNYCAALFTVADLAHIDAAHFVKLMDVYVASDASVVCSAYVDKSELGTTVLGVPALFRRPLFAELMALAGDVGAKRIIAKYSNSLVSVEIESASFDIDTEADFSKLIGV